MKYRIVRMYYDRERAPCRRIVKRGLTYKEAVAHCRDPETSSSTCKKARSLQRTEKCGPWFDGFEKDA